MNYVKLPVVLLALLVGTFVSCEKNKYEPTSTASIETQTYPTKDGGEDDEEPIVQGMVFIDSVLATNVETAIYEEFATTELEHSASNPSSFQVPEGNYFLRIFPPNQSPVNTSVFVVTANMDVKVYLQ